jgi:hypothetical protein
VPSDKGLGASGTTAASLATAYAAAAKQWTAAVSWQGALKATPKAACVGTSANSLCSSSSSEGARHTRQ